MCEIYQQMLDVKNPYKPKLNYTLKTPLTSLKHSLPTAAAGSWIYHQLFLLLLFIKLVINIMIVLPHKGKKAITRLLDQLSHHCNSPLWLYTPPSPTTLSLQIHLEVQNRNIETYIYILILIIYYRNMNFLLSVYTVHTSITEHCFVAKKRENDP